MKLFPKMSATTKMVSRMKWVNTVGQHCRKSRLIFAHNCVPTVRIQGTHHLIFAQSLTACPFSSMTKWVDSKCILTEVSCVRILLLEFCFFPVLLLHPQVSIVYSLNIHAFVVCVLAWYSYVGHRSKTLDTAPGLQHNWAALQEVHVTFCS